MHILKRLFLVVTSIIMLGLVGWASTDFANMSDSNVLLVCALVPGAMAMFIGSFHNKSRGNKAFAPALFFMSLCLSMITASQFVHEASLFCLFLAAISFLFVTIPMTGMTACAYRLVRC